MANDVDNERILTDPEYVAVRRYGYSTNSVVARYPDGAPNHVIGAALDMEEGEVDEEYQRIIDKLKVLIGVNNDEES